ncbi:MAG: PKD domain-containing protein, partial [Candidatus Poseidoniales archaeon]
MRNSVASLFILTLLLLFPLTSVDFLEDDKRSNAVSTGVYDVPTWRIGDEWVYETKFDVVQLLQQANVAASIVTLTGDTSVTVTNILFMTLNGTQTLVYEVKITGVFTTGANGAELQGQRGSVDVDYDGIDIFRVNDLSLVSSEFNLFVEFFPNSQFVCWFTNCELADINFFTSYEPVKEKRDFPIRTGDQWHQTFYSQTIVTGTSDYFDPNEFQTQGPENNSWQITNSGVPTEDGTTIQYSGCADSLKIMEWNETGINAGFEWFCPEARNYAWSRVDNSAGFQIDWLLKEYRPIDSSNVIAASNPGNRDVEIIVEPQYLAILPNAEESINATYASSSGTGVPNSNLQLRYEMTSTYVSTTTSSSGLSTMTLNVSDVLDDSPAGDDHTSNGVIVWDPVTKIIGVATIIMDLSVVGVDLVAKADSIIVERNRGGVTTVLSQSNGYNALPNDELSFSIPAQNRGIFLSPATEIEVTTPDGSTIRSSIPGVAPYTEQRITVNWTVPEATEVGDQTLGFVVDPDELVTEDANRSNNMASISIYIGRLPTANAIIDEGKYTFENVTIDASTSFDEDGGEVICRFEIEYAPLLIDAIDSENCVINYMWNDDGAWNVTVIAIDDELDEDVITIQANILNRAPTFNLTGPIAVDVGTQVTFQVADAYDQDTITEDPSQQVIFSWPDTFCDGTILGPTCTFTAMQEGMMDITLIGTDDDGESVTISQQLEVLNVNPTIGEIEFWANGVFVEKDVASGVWSINESTEVQLRITADDSTLDKDGLIINWKPSDRDSNWSISTDGPNSEVNLSWNTSGFHEITVKATDDNGATSQIIFERVMVKNLAPVLKAMDDSYNISEDDAIPLIAEAIDTDELTYCWDLDANTDGDDNGILYDDCDLPGAELEFSKGYSGSNVLTVNVWDDDGAWDYHSITINVINQRPIAVIDDAEEGFIITQGEDITLSGSNSIDSASDRLTLRYIWDNPTIPGFEDGVGEQFTISFDKPGTYLVNLTVYDDDSESTTASISITVTEVIEDSAFGSASTATMTVTIAAFIIVILALLLILRRRPKDADVLGLGMQDSAFSFEPKYDAAPAGLPGQTTATGETFYQQY